MGNDIVQPFVVGVNLHVAAHCLEIMERFWEHRCRVEIFPECKDYLNVFDLLTGSQDRVASLHPFDFSSSYFRARRPISVVQTGCRNINSLIVFALQTCFNSFFNLLHPFGLLASVRQLKRSVDREAQKSAGVCRVAEPGLSKEPFLKFSDIVLPPHSGRKASWGAHCEVSRMREQNCPGSLDPLVEVHGSLGGVCLEVRDDVAQAQHLSQWNGPVEIDKRPYPPEYRFAPP